MTTSDLPAVAELLRASRPTPRGGEHPPLWLFRRVAEGELGGSARVWRDPAGGLGAAGLVLDGGFLEFLVRPGPDAERVAAEVVAWASEQAPELIAQASSWDAERIGLLERLGFAADGRGGVRMARPTADLPPPELPSGFHLRPVAGEAELDTYLALFRAAFGDGPSADSRRRLWRNREYRRDLDVVLVGPDDRLAGFCLAWIYGEENAVLGLRDGWIEQMGVHPDLRRRGLGRALLRAGLAGLRRHGVESAYLETGEENAAARALYAAEGFRDDAAVLRYRCAR